jgi:phosphoribosylanthranilate isomerase
MPTRPLVKICCIAGIAEAQLAIAAGAAALGLVSAMPSGPGVIDESLIADIIATVPPPIATFLLTALQDADAIIAQHRRCPTSVLQLVDHVPHTELRRLRQALPGIKLVQVLHVTDLAVLEQAMGLPGLVDALLLDSGNPALAVKQLGGTGRTHDWQISRQIREQVALPLFLAGGLHADNVAQALGTVAPFGLDVCSGVRSNGQLDPDKLARFMRAVV